MKKISLLVMSCDTYNDVLDNFFKIWNKNIPWWIYPIYLVTEEREYRYDGVETITPGKVSWNDRIKYALSKIDSDYILYMQDDYFVGENIDEEVFQKILNLIFERSIKFYKLVNYPKINNHLYDNQYISLIPDNKRYGINLWPAIIEKEWLIKTLPKHSCNPWEVEVFFLEKVNNHFTKYIDLCVVDTRNIMEIHDGIRKGKWWRPTLKYFQKKGIAINTGKRQKASIFESMKAKVFTNIRQAMSASSVRAFKKIFSKLGKKYITNK